MSRDSKPIKILSVLPVLGQPRHSKRLEMLRGNYSNVQVAYFDREYHNGRLPDVKKVCLGSIRHGKFASRVFKFVLSIPKLRALINKSDVIYVSNADMAYLCVIASLFLKRIIVLEIGDIRKIQTSKLYYGQIIRVIEKQLLKSCSLMVVTSEHYINEYYRKWVGSNIETLVLENKLEKGCGFKEKRSLFEKSNKDVITIGYFGLLRCSWTFKTLERLVMQYPNKFEVLVAGYSILKEYSSERIAHIEGFKYFGKYKSPLDLPKLYNQVDIVWGCYPYPDNSDWNWRWARTNRFYESLFFSKPIIALEHSGDSSFIKENNLGVLLPLDKDLNNVVNHLNKIDRCKLTVWRNNIKNVPEEVYIYTNETELLISRINRLLV